MIEQRKEIVQLNKQIVTLNENSNYDPDCLARYLDEICDLKNEIDQLNIEIIKLNSKSKEEFIYEYFFY